MRKIEKLIPSLKRIAKKHIACENIVPWNRERIYISGIFLFSKKSEKKYNSLSNIILPHHKLKLKVSC